MKFLKPLLPTLAAVIFAVGVSHADFFYKWSTTANNNANSDTFTWAEGQAPSTVNDSARGMMAALAKYRNDTSGQLVTAGGTTSFTLTTNQVFSSLALMDGAELAFRMNATSAASPTLNVDGLGAKALSQTSGTAVATGALAGGGVYRAVYVNASNEWIVAGIAGQVPSGTTLLSMTACPAGWTTSGAFNDRALVISSSTPGSAAGVNAFSAYFGGAGAVASHTLTAAEIPPHTHHFNVNSGNENVGHSHNIPGLGIVINSGGGLIISSGAVYGILGSFDTGGESATHFHNVTGDTDTGAGVAGGGHVHTIPSLQYVTAIACTKN